MVMEHSPLACNVPTPIESFVRAGREQIRVDVHTNINLEALHDDRSRPMKVRGGGSCANNHVEGHKYFSNHVSPSFARAARAQAQEIKFASARALGLESRARN